MKVNIVTPFKYSAWPMVGSQNGKIICIYTIANRHEATEASLYMKTSFDGRTWSDANEIFKEKTGVKGVTGMGNDSEGNALIWYRDGAPGGRETTYELYKIYGDTMTLVSKPDLDIRGAHIGNIFQAEGNVLFSFYNTYGAVRSFGILKSVDDGMSWEEIPIEVSVEKPECPVEIDGFYAGDGKILALGRKDSADGTVAMFQIESSDFGASWSKKYTNVTDSYQSSPYVIFEPKEEKICLYYFERSTGKLKRRTALLSDAWSNPLGWCVPEIISEESWSGEDTGNVKVVKMDGAHLAVYYAGTNTTTGIYGVIVQS